MRAIPLFILTVLPILVFSCGPADSSYLEARADREHVAWSSMPTHGEKETPDYEKQAYAQAPAFATGREQKQKRTGRALTYFPVHHPQYTMPTRFVPLPRHWQVGQYWTTPSGTKAGVLTSGKLPPHVTSVDQVINQIFLPKLNGRITVKKMESLPEIAQADQEEQEGYYSYMPTRNYTQAKGIAFVEHDTGNRGYCVVHLLIKTSQAGRYGSYWVSNLTNDEFYNPQRDPNRNHYEWRRMHYPGNN